MRQDISHDQPHLQYSAQSLLEPSLCDVLDDMYGVSVLPKLSVFNNEKSTHP